MSKNGFYNRRMQSLLIFAVSHFFREVFANSSTLVVATCREGYPPFVIPDGQGGFSGYDIGNIHISFMNHSVTVHNDCRRSLESDLFFYGSKSAGF